MSPGLNKKLYAAIGALAFCLCSIALPFSVYAATPFDVGTQVSVTVKSTDIDPDSGVVEPLWCRVDVVPFAPKLLSYESSVNPSGMTLQFKNSSGNNFTGTITQNGSAYNTEGSSSYGFSFNYTGTGTSQKLSSATATETATSSGSITGLSFNGLPTTATFSGGSVSNSYLYEEQYDVYFQLRNTSGAVYQFNTTPPRIEFMIDTTHITGTLVGGDIEQIDGFGEVGLQRIYQNNNGLRIAVTAANDYLYSNRITLSPGMMLQGHFIISCYVLRTAVTTAIPTVNSVNIYNYQECRAYDGVNPSILWNLYYINQKLDHLITNPDSQTTGDLTYGSQNWSNTLDSQHTTEESYFNQNQSNLQATGISNFQFDSDISSGLGTITSDFSSLWNALGQWKFIYTFTLLIGLATFLIRHRSATGGKRRSDKSNGRNT